MKLAVLALITALIATPAVAQRLDGRPTILDSKTVSAQDDRIEFDLGREDGMITQIRLRTVDMPIAYRNVEITFGNGTTQTVEMIERLEPGEQGRAIDLEGDRRFIRRVVVQKRPSWRPGSGKVELLGLVQPRPAPPAPPPRPAPPMAGGYDLIDQVTVNKQSDQVVFTIPRGEGPFSRIKLKALDDGILVRKIEIFDRSGRVQTLDVAERLEAGEESPDITIEGRGDIERVVVTKRPSWRPGESRLALAGVEIPRPAPPPPAPPAPPRGPGHGFDPGWVLIAAGNLPVTGAAGPTFQRPESSIPGVGRPIERPAGPATRVAVIPIGGREVGQFKSIGLRLVGGDVQLSSITIIYGNKERDRIAISSTLTDRSRTQPIQLKGDRFIREIEVEYSKRREERTTLEIYGDYSDKWLGESGSRRDYNQGWVLLGAQRAQMFGKDADTFDVGKRFGAFRAIKVVSRDAPVRFYGLRVYYENGEAEDVAFSGELGPGQSSQPIDLKGRRSRIDRVSMRYRTRLNFLGDGVVEVWGLQ